MLIDGEHDGMSTKGTSGYKVIASKVAETADNPKESPVKISKNKRMTPRKTPPLGPTGGRMILALSISFFLLSVSSFSPSIMTIRISGFSLPTHECKTTHRNGIVNDDYLSQTKAPSQSRMRPLLNSAADTSTDDASPELGGGQVPPFSVTLEGEDYSYQEAVQRTLGWVGAAALFGTGLWAVAGSGPGEEFFAGYLVEQSLSVDNLFVFLLLFEYFKVPLKYQDRVLNWGIYGALIMRAIMVGLGAAALQNFHAILLVFASILVYSSAKVFIGGGDDEDEDPSQNFIVRFSHNLINSTSEYDGDRFFTVVDGIRKATPLFICMIAIEISDVVFAVDSIPAVFGVTENPLVVFTSNMFAIMGLRSLYTILSKAATDLEYLEPSVALVLGFIGAKMIAEYFGYHIPTEIALSVVASFLGIGVGASLWDKRELAPDDANTE